MQVVVLPEVDRKQNIGIAFNGKISYVLGIDFV